MKTFLQVLGLCVFSNFGFSSKCFPQIYRVQYGAAMLDGTSWWLKNSVNIWNLFWLFSQLIIWTEQRNVYTLTSTFSTNLTSIKARKSQHRCMLQTQLKLYVTQRHNSEIKNVLVSKQNALLSEKFSTDINLAPLCLMRIKTFVGL